MGQKQAGTDGADGAVREPVKAENEKLAHAGLTLRDRLYLLGRRTLDFFYPRRCVLCGDIIPADEQAGTLCHRCREPIPFLSGRLCPHCGVPLEMGDAVYCRRCEKLRDKDAFAYGFAAFLYPRVRPGIYLLKYGGLRNNGDVLAGLMHAYLFREHPHGLERIDALVPVPLHKNRRRERGFNQAELLAQGLSRRTGVPCREVLERVRDTEPQSRLHPRDRAGNLRKAFALRPGEDVRGQRLMLIDDVFTTGATMNECARVLRRAGAAEVVFYTLAVAETPKRQGKPVGDE